jgi:hypothetical protein
MQRLNKKDYIYENLEEQTLRKPRGAINGQSFAIRNLKNCTVFLNDFISSVYLVNCENCSILTGPISGSIFIRNSKGLTV